MDVLSPRRLFDLCAVSIGLLAALFILAVPATAADATYDCDGSGLDFENPTLLVPPTATDNLECQWDLFAWNSFAALNWPADPKRRGFPDLAEGVTFLGAASGTETVWESFKEKREVFRENPSTVWNDVPDFPVPINLTKQNGGYCSPQEAATARSKKVVRRIFQPGKVHNTLDETTEVAGEALEPNPVLCQGHGPDCEVHGKAVGPRVWKGKPDDDPTKNTATPIYYEVKVNYDFFEYVIHKKLYDDHQALTSAIHGEIRLPVRAGYATGGGPSVNPGVTKTPYTSKHCLSVYQGTGDTPCAVGSIHTKSAWISTSALDDPADYHTTSAIYYKDDPSDPGKICMAVDQFGLLGLHIIQRVHQPNKSGNPTLGGTFVFATWEHKGILDETGGSDFYYVNYLLSGDSKQLTPYPTLSNAIEVRRLLIPPANPPQKPAGCGLSQGQTCIANSLAEKALGNSVWSNYQLVGTQFAAVSSQEASQAIAQPYFLANLLIETNQGLQQFMGLPPDQPRVQPPQWSSPSSENGKVYSVRAVPDNFGFGFNRGTNNITYGGQGLNMGGCMGCHGVAQQNGYAFSFVLLDGTRGATADTESEENIPPTNLTFSSAQQVVSLAGPVVLQEGAGAAVGVGKDPTTAATAQWELVPYHGDPSYLNAPGFYLLRNVASREVLTANGTGVQLRDAPLQDSGGNPAGPLDQLWRLIPYGDTSAKRILIANGIEGTSGILYLSILGATSAGSPVTVTALAPDPKTAGQLWSLQDPPEEGAVATPAAH